MPEGGKLKRPDAPIDDVGAKAFRIPTDQPEADGTLGWTSTTLVTCVVSALGTTGLGYTYADLSAAHLINGLLAELLKGRDALAIPSCWRTMADGVRNLGRCGIGAMSISAVDVALWDLKAKLVGISLVSLLGAARDAVSIYGSGGFTSYDDDHLCRQLAGWVEQDGCPAVKMKVGTEPERDLERARLARNAIGTADLYVDANGALSRKQALDFSERYGELGITWFEEPVSSDDLEGLRLIRDRGPAGMDIAAGEYGYESFYFRRMLESGAVDVLQADATRCGGYTGFLKAAALADAWGLPLSAHTAPALHLPVCCAASRLRNIEWFHDHVRIERAVFDGVPAPRHGNLHPDRSRPGHGLILREQDAERLAA